MAHLTFEDFPTGKVFPEEVVKVNRDEMVAFAQRFDPQPFHIREDFEKNASSQHLIASGWFTLSLLVRIYALKYFFNSSIYGGLGMSELRWMAPVYPGDSLTIRVRILEARLAQSKPGFGIITLQAEIRNQKEEQVFSNESSVLMACRDVKIESKRRFFPNDPDWKEPVCDKILPATYIDDVPIGKKFIIGVHKFSEEDIVDYAKLYDPQPFHIDREAAKNTFFGGLCSSGILTAALWTTFSVRYNQEAMEKAAKMGLNPPPRFGVSPGFKNLNWYYPVFVGDTLVYKTEILAKRHSKSIPGWGLLTLKASAENQHGQKVIDYIPTVLLERKSDKRDC